MSATKKVIVHDGMRETSVEVDAARHKQLENFVASQPGLIGDGSDVGGRVVRDAGEAQAFLVSQLAYTEGQVYARQYLPTQFRQLIPVSNEAGAWATSVRYEKTDFAGQAQWASDKSTKFPTANVQYDDVDRPIHHALAGYEYTLQELRETAYLRRPLNERRMVACMEMVERFYNRVGLYGDAKKGLTGLFNSADVPQDVSGMSKGWDDPTASVLEILGDFNKMLYTPFKASQYNDMPDTAVIPPAAFQFFAVTPVVINGVALSMTILQWLKLNNVAKAIRNIDLNIVPGFGLDTGTGAPGQATKGGSSGGKSRCVVYVNNRDRVVMHISLPLQFIAPQFQGATVLVPGETRLGGVEFRYPSSAFYYDSVLSTD